MELFDSHQVSVSVTGWNARQEDLAMVAMSDGAQAVAVIQAPKSDTQRFSLFADEDLVFTIAAFLPSVPAMPGDTVTVEQRPAPAMSAMAAWRRAEAEETAAFRNVDVTTRLVRLRLLNGSNARLYNFGFSDDRSFSLVATDGGLLAEPWETGRLYLSPGERAEIVVAFEPGERVELRSYPSEHGGALGRLDGFDDSLDICQFRAARTLADDTEVPAKLGTAPDLAREAVAEKRSFTLAADQINGRSMAMDRIDFGVREGTVEVWEVTGWRCGSATTPTRTCPTCTTDHDERTTPHG